MAPPRPGTRLGKLWPVGVDARCVFRLIELHAAAGRSPRGLLRALQAIREVTVMEPGSRGRPRIRRQLEELSPDAERLAACFDLLPIR